MLWRDKVAKQYERATELVSQRASGALQLHRDAEVADKSLALSCREPTMQKLFR